MRTRILFGLYLTGILIAWIPALIFGRILFKQGSSPFVMELPPYRMPTAMILIASLLIWALASIWKMPT